jgi:hypothetical protein
MPGKSDESFRHECETKYWWKATHGNPALIREALERISKKRSAAGVEKLRQGLAEIYRREKDGKD